MGHTVAMTTEEYETRVESLINAAQSVLRQFTSGYHPSEHQLNALDGALMGLTALKTCGHRITEDCSCEEQQP